MSWSNEHGPDRVYHKFRVTRVRTGEELPVTEFYFVLRPQYDEAACVALLAYAHAVEYRAPNLAQQLRDLTMEIIEANAQETAS